MPHFPLRKSGIKVGGSRGASFAQLCPEVSVLRAEKGKSRSAQGRDSSLPFLLPKRKSFGEKHLVEGQGSCWGEFKSLVEALVPPDQTEAGSARAAEGCLSSVLRWRLDGFGIRRWDNFGIKIFIR